MKLNVLQHGFTVLRSTVEHLLHSKAESLVKEVGVEPTKACELRRSGYGFSGAWENRTPNFWVQTRRVPISTKTPLELVFEELCQ